MTTPSNLDEFVPKLTSKVADTWTSFFLCSIVFREIGATHYRVPNFHFHRSAFSYQPQR